MGHPGRKEAGERAEAAALAHLLAAGLKRVTQNHRCKGGEIDLVMLEAATLVLVEVRYRRNKAFGGAAASVVRRKQRRLLIAARHLLRTHPELNRYPARFDVVAIELTPQGTSNLEWIKDAFRAA